MAGFENIERNFLVEVFKASIEFFSNIPKSSSRNVKQVDLDPSSSREQQQAMDDKIFIPYLLTNQMILQFEKDQDNRLSLMDII